MAFDSFISDFNYDCIRDAKLKDLMNLNKIYLNLNLFKFKILNKINNFNAKLLEKVKLLKGSIKNNLQTYDKKTSKSFQLFEGFRLI